MSAFKNIKSIELQHSGLTAKHNMAISTKKACKETMINLWNLSGRSVQTVSQSYTVDVYLTTLLNPRRLHTTACRTLSCWSASAEKNNIIINIIKNSFKRLSSQVVRFSHQNKFKEEVFYGVVVCYSLCVSMQFCNHPMIF